MVINILSVTLALALTLPALATTTPNDDYIAAEDRTIPRISREYSLSLTDATVGTLALDHDVKSALIVVSGDAVQCWPSFDNGTTDTLAGVTLSNSIQSSPSASNITNSKANATAEKTIKSIADGSQFYEAQQSEFNKINCAITDGSGSAALLIYTGRGLKN